MSKHTPGPWRAWRDGNGFWDVDASYQVYKDDFGNAIEIFDAPERYSVLEDPTTEDARLIAAAPEMLAMLQKLAMREHSSGYCSSCDGRCELKALISKVEGREDG